MAQNKFSQTQQQSLKTSAKLFGQLRLSHIMQLDNGEFEELIQEVESQPLFKRLMFPKDAKCRREKILSYSRFPHTQVQGSLYDFPEQRLASQGRIDVDGILAGHGRLSRLISRMGIDKFKKYFLYNEQIFSLEKLAKECRLSVRQCRDIIDLVNKISLHVSRNINSRIGEGIKYANIASIYKGKGNFVIAFSDLSLARGRYEIDSERLSELRQAGVFSGQESLDINRLINKLNLINLRKSIIFNILRAITDKQRDFFEGGRESDIIPLTQREVAAELGISPSLISRAIKHKSIRTAWEKEKPLKDFFPSLKTVRLGILRALIRQNLILKSDEQIRDLLKKKYGIYVCRRTVSKYRKELAVPCYGKGQ